jgi:2-dehydro-3-deoxyglucarate aldolase/4-hydroxy-2-oxoheptanedioate aldolase
VHPLVRVVRPEYALIAPALDAGSGGVMAPMVETAQQARVLVESVRYPPLGRRGFGVLMSDELADGPGARAERANRENVVIAQIESPQGIENAEEILAVPGIDVAWLGQFDLSLALGVPGRFDHPTYLEAVDHIVRAAGARGIPLGQLVGSVEDGRAMRERGFQVLAFADVWVFERALRESLDGLRR